MRASRDGGHVVRRRGQMQDELLQKIFKSLLGTKDHAASLSFSSAMSPRAAAGRAGLLTGSRPPGGGDGAGEQVDAGSGTEDV